MSNGITFSGFWMPVGIDPVPDGETIDICYDASGKTARMTDVVYLDDCMYDESTLSHDPNGDMPDPIDLCHIDEVTHWMRPRLQSGGAE